MLLRLRNILQKFITKIESVLDQSSVWGCVQNPFESKRRKKSEIQSFCFLPDVKDGDVFSLSLEPFSQIGRRKAGLVQVQCTICLGKCTGRVQWTKHNARMYVQSTEARRESHCWEQFERRADLPDEEVDVLFLQRKRVKTYFTSVKLLSFFVEQMFPNWTLFSFAPIQLHYNTKFDI